MGIYSPLGDFINDVIGVNSQNEFNANEAQKQRDWEEGMANTAHQREVADMKAAGINPALSADGGRGASVPAGASASAGSSPAVNILTSILGAAVSLHGQAANAIQSEVAFKTAQSVMKEMKADAKSMRNTATSLKFAANDFYKKTMV